MGVDRQDGGGHASQREREPSSQPTVDPTIARYFAGLKGVTPGPVVTLEGPHRRLEGKAWVAELPQLEELADSSAAPTSPVVLFEDEAPLGPGYCNHEDIARDGCGRYSHWGSSLIFATSDDSDPNRNGRRYRAVVVDRGLGLPAQTERSLLPPFLTDGGFAWVAQLPGSAQLSDEGQYRRSQLRVFEDGVELGPAHSYHDQVRWRGAGRFSHWGAALYFSTSDGSDPNTNGREYTFRMAPAQRTPADDEKRAYLERWYRKRELFLTEPTRLWELHPDGDWFRRHGGDEIAPPIYANLVGLTSYCNLKCTICGSQEAIDHEGVPRRNMRPEVMHAVADTVFPGLIVLILASLGEPTIYPHFNEVLERAHRWGASIKIESNATALTERMIKLLTSVKGELFFSLDATGGLFEDVRRGARWQQAERNVRNLLAARDRELTKVNLYPTISRRTLPDMLNVAKWALAAGIEEITFHSYDPTMFAKEERPGPDEFAAENDKLREWLDGEARKRDLSDFSVKVNAVEINPHFSREVQGIYPLAVLPRNHPLAESEYVEGGYRCVTPQQNVDIGPDGEIYPCVWSGARPQENTMGKATSKESFAEAWFGARYRELREQLRVGCTAEPNVAQCTTCLKRYSRPGDQMD